MERSAIASMLGVELRVRLEPPYSRLTVVMLLELCRNVKELVVACSEQGRQIVEALLELCSRNKVRPPIVEEEPRRDGIAPIATLWKTLPPELEQRVVFAVGVSVKGLRVLRAFKTGPSEYLLRVGNLRELVRVTQYGLVRAELPEELVKALSVICEAINQYGPLKLRDAVDVLAAETGLKRGEARRLLVELAARRLVRVECGYVLCTE